MRDSKNVRSSVPPRVSGDSTNDTARDAARWRAFLAGAAVCVNEEGGLTIYADLLDDYDLAELPSHAEPVGSLIAHLDSMGITQERDEVLRLFDALLMAPGPWVPWQLENDPETYAGRAGWWILTSANGEDEHPDAGCWATEAEAIAAAAAANASNDGGVS